VAAKIRPMINHRLGYISNLSMSMDTPYLDIATYGGIYPNMIRTPGHMTIDMQIIVPEANIPRNIGNYLLGLQQPFINYAIQSEFQCLYCGRPNSIDRTDCMSCGAIRSFVLG
jgi:hypothetical protein